MLVERETKNIVQRIQTAKLHRHTDNPQMGQNGSEKWIRKTDMGKVPAPAGKEMFGNSVDIVYLSVQVRNVESAPRSNYKYVPVVM